jgi:hypothetical protein
MHEFLKEEEFNKKMQKKLDELNQGIISLSDYLQEYLKQSKMSSTKPKWVDEEIERVRKEFPDTPEEENKRYEGYFRERDRMFWEGELKSKDESWKDKIVSLRNKKSGAILHRGERDQFTTMQCIGHGAVYLQDLFATDKYEIYTVKSDSGIEFSIGDDIGFFGTINKFEVRENKVNAFVSNPNGEYGQWGWFEINELSKSEPKKQPLFTTVEGKKIFEGDEYYFVDLNFVLHKSHANIQRNQANPPNHFSTEEKAKQYIAENKPSISFEELHKFVMKQFGSKLWMDDWWSDLLWHFKPKK